MAVLGIDRESNGLNHKLHDLIDQLDPREPLMSEGSASK